jgi:hypothetical protein
MSGESAAAAGAAAATIAIGTKARANLLAENITDSWKFAPETGVCGLNAH